MESITNSIGMKFNLIPEGEFIMGSDFWMEAKPAHKAIITKPFYIGVYPVTQIDWLRLMADNPSDFSGYSGCLERPVDSVNYEMVKKFLAALSSKEGRKYRLPTEAEWEYACRADSTTTYFHGDNSKELSSYAWYWENSGAKEENGDTKPVGKKLPNKFGLYDMLGNVCELCEDGYDSFEDGIRIDPKGADGGSIRVMKGGCWNYPGGKSIKSNSKNLVTSFWRGKVKYSQIDHGHGFRLVLEVC